MGVYGQVVYGSGGLYGGLVDRRAWLRTVDEGFGFITPPSRGLRIHHARSSRLIDEHGFGSTSMAHRERGP